MTRVSQIREDLLTERDEGTEGRPQSGQIGINLCSLGYLLWEQNRGLPAFALELPWASSGSHGYEKRIL